MIMIKKKFNCLSYAIHRSFPPQTTLHTNQRAAKVATKSPHSSSGRYVFFKISYHTIKINTKPKRRREKKR
ncbi:hypothetical protein M413DRAFT_245584 [Hebeloma cylindrosporum]|uniref:Uncharacterized protein n=1 Tax=Hebeloma cylindrosporum TaxID=76867 RepID=A0A0C2XKV7_HEBCY|nr:hypothetical protein M413DRAFT_245584 [Hebeloma cylindrosporum h7]